jgi:hypothetical protein
MYIPVNVCLALRIWDVVLNLNLSFFWSLCAALGFFFNKVEFVRPLNLKSIQNDQGEIGLGLGWLEKNLRTPIWVKT